MSAARFKAFLGIASASAILLPFCLILSGCSLSGGIFGQYDWKDTPVKGTETVLMNGANSATGMVRNVRAAALRNYPRGKRLLKANDSSSGSQGTVTLVRESDCSITEDNLGITGSSASDVSIQVTSAVQNFQDQLHSLAGLTTTPDRWANGCKNPLGVPASVAVSLGLTKDGSQLIGAAISPYDNNLYTVAISPSGGALTTSQITSVPNPNLVAAADLNGDGINDLVVLDIPYPQKNDPGGIYVFLSNGDGTFQQPKVYATGISGVTATITDVNGDGKLDIVVAANNNGTAASTGIAVLLGNGDGTFKTAVTSASAGGQYVAAGDLNGDGKADLVFDSGAVQLGNGDGTFKASAFTLPGSHNGGGMPAIADFNNDGKLDVALNQPAITTIAIYNGNGDGTFTTGHVYAGIYTTPELGAVDLDGDGNMDLLTGINAAGVFGPDPNSYGVLQVLMGYGDGTFNGASAYPDTALANFAVGDFNGDGKPDLLGAAVTSSIYEQSNGLQLLVGDGKGNFAPAAPTGVGMPVMIAAADMNGDGKLDAVFDNELSSGGTDLAVALGDGKGNFGTATEYAAPDGDTMSFVTTGDFNGDGKPDVLAEAGNTGSDGSINETLYLYLNNGDGTLKTPLQIGSPQFLGEMSVADLNGDGKLDIAVINEGTLPASGGVPTGGSVEVYLGNGDGTFKAPFSYAGTFLGFVAIGDVNNDGKPDLVATTASSDGSTGYLSVFLGNGDGTFQTPVNTTMPDTSIGQVAVGDFNGDGKPDVLVGDCCGLATTHIALGNGDGTFPTVSSLPIGLSSLFVATADVNGDKLADALLVTADSGNSPVAIETLLSTGAASTAATTTTLSASATAIAPGANVAFTATVAPSSGSGTPTGTVTFLDGTTTLGTGTLSSGVATYSTSSLASGTHSITAVYSGSSTFSASTSSAITVTVSGSTPTLAPTSTTLTASATSAVSGTSLTFTAAVAETSGTATPTGTVTFMDGATTLGTGTLASGKSTYSTASLAVGTHSITAAYGGDSSNAASTSSAVSVVITAAATGDFSIALSPGSGSIAQGSSATDTVSITPSGGFNQQVSFACSGLPKYASCSFSPSTITPSGSSAATTTLTIKTDVSTAALERPVLPAHGESPGGTTALAFLGGAGFFGLSLFRMRRKNGHGTTFFALAAAMILIACAVTGCGSSGTKTPAGTYQVTVTGTAGNDTHTATYALTVQ